MCDVELQITLEQQLLKGLTQTGMAIALSYKTQNGATTVATVIAATAVHYPVAARTKTSNILVH